MKTLAIFITQLKKNAKLSKKSAFLLATLFIYHFILAANKPFDRTLLHSGFNSIYLLDTTKENEIAKDKIQSKDPSYISISTLLKDHPVFNNHWITDETFVYEDIEFDDIPNNIPLQLIRINEGFKLTWYGKINSPFKQRWGRFHQGIDIDLKTGDSVFSAFDGIVRYAQFNKSGYGNCIVIRHLNGLETVYGHLSKHLVSANQFVKAGSIIGLGGSTGRSTGPHLHFEVRYKDFSFDPLLIINPETQTLRSDSIELKKSNLYAFKYGRAHKRVATPEKEQGINLDSISYADYTTTVDLTEKSITIDNTKLNDEVIPISKTETEEKPNIPVAPKKKLIVAEKKKNTDTNKKKVKLDKNKANNKKTKSKKEAQTKNTKKIKPGVHIVKKGESLSVIAEKTGVPIKTLRTKNKIKSDKKLMPGDKIKL
jgi:LysM repeat protein